MAGDRAQADVRSVLESQGCTPSPMQRFVFNLSNPDSPGGEAILFVAEKHEDFTNHEIHMNCYGQLATIQTTDTLNSDTMFRLAEALREWEQQN